MEFLPHHSPLPWGEGTESAVEAGLARGEVEAHRPRRGGGAPVRV